MMQRVFRRPSSAPPVVPEDGDNSNNDGLGDDNGYEKNDKGNKDEDSIESLDSFYSSKSGLESLDSLPPFSPLTPITTPFRRSWRKSSAGRRSPSGNSVGSSNRSVSSENANGNTGKKDDSTAGRSSKISKLFASSPKVLFKGSSTSSSTAQQGEQKNIAGEAVAPKTPLPVTTISQQHPTQLLSPLTPFTTAVNNDVNDTIEEETSRVASNNSTPTANNAKSSDDFAKEENVESKNQSSIDNRRTADDALDQSPIPDKPQSNNDGPELQSALDSLEQNLKEMQYSNNQDDGYDAFLHLINSPGAVNTNGADHEQSLAGEKLLPDDEETAADRNMVNKEDEVVVLYEVQEQKSDARNGSNDCQCFWFPKSIMSLFQGLKPNPTPIVIPPLPDEDSNNLNDNDGNDDTMQNAVEHLRASLKVITKHTHTSLVPNEEKEVILSEVGIIEGSLAKISLVIDSIG